MNETLRFNKQKWEKIASLIASDGHIPFSQRQAQYARLKLVLTRLLVENFLVLAFQYAGLMMAVIETQMPIQLATGTACAFIFLRGYSILPGIFLGTLIAFWIGHYPVSQSILYAGLLTLQTFTLYGVSCWLNIPTLIFYQKKPFYQFMGLMFIITGMTAYALSSEAWLTRWIVNINGILISSFALVAWDAFFPQLDELKQASKRGKLKAYLFFSALISITCLMLGLNDSYLFLLMSLISVLMTLYVGWRYAWFGVVLTIFISGMILGFGMTIVGKENFMEHYKILLLVQAITGYGFCLYFHPLFNSQLSRKEHGAIS